MHMLRKVNLLNPIFDESFESLKKLLINIIFYVIIKYLSCSSQKIKKKIIIIIIIIDIMIYSTIYLFDECVNRTQCFSVKART